MDLREKLSGVTSQNHQTTQAQEAPKAQRRVASMVFNSSNATPGVASTTAPAPVSARPTATVKRPSVPMVLPAVSLLCSNFRYLLYSISFVQSLSKWTFEPNFCSEKLIGTVQVLYCLLSLGFGTSRLHSFARLVSWMDIKSRSKQLIYLNCWFCGSLKSRQFVHFFIRWDWRNTCLPFKLKRYSSLDFGTRFVRQEHSSRMIYDQFVSYRSARSAVFLIDRCISSR